MTNDPDTEIRARKRLLLTITGGGHKFQAVSLASQLVDAHDLIVVTTAKWNVEKEAQKLDAPVFEVPPINTFSHRNPAATAWRFLRALKAARSIITETKPDAVIAVGTNIGIPLFVWGRLRGIPCIFIESITRVEHWSTTLRLAVALRLCDRYFIQWPELADPARRLEFEGTVL